MDYSNYDYFMKKNFDNYSGKWIAIINKEVVASGDNAGNLIKKVKKEYPSKVPFITKIRNKLSIL